MSVQTGVGDRVRVTATGAALGAIAEGIDLNHPSPELIHALRDALLKHQVLCIRKQDLSPAALLHFAGLLGTVPAIAESRKHPDFPQINVRSSDDTVFAEGKRKVGGTTWHTDGSYFARPNSFTLLYGVEVPPVGGDTQFANLYASYDALTDEVRQKVDGMKATFNVATKKSSRIKPLTPEQLAARPIVIHPIVRTHPETGRKGLYVCPARVEKVVGMSQEESDEILNGLSAYETEERFQYSHRWQQGDLVIWDNRCCLHRANGDYPPGTTRLMHRICLEGSVPV